MKNKIIFFSIAIVSIAIAAFILFSGGDKREISVGSNNKITLNIIGMTGTGTQFLNNARDEFIAMNPNIEINYIGLGTFDAVEDIVKEEKDYDAWICADETGTEMLKYNYSNEHNGKNVVLEATPIVASPLVIVGWEERMDKLGNITISSLYDIVSEGKTWEAVGGKPDWGFVNFSHTDPVDSNSGAQFITLLIHDYYSRNGSAKKDLAIEDVANESLVQYVKAFEKNTAKQEGGSGKFMQSLVTYGPSRYDMGAIYEYYALANIKNAQGRWGNLKIVYPKPTIWSNRPFIVLNGKNSTNEKINACKKFKEYLLSKEVQQKAMLEGFRPANMEVSDISALENEYGKYGFKKDISAAVPAPDVKVIEAIQAMIKRIQ